jgi:protein kinase C substrate 80K-H
VHGPDDTFFPLKDQCFDIVSGVFTYTMCPFGKASQSEMRKKTKEWDAGKHSITIGSWAGFDPAVPHTMLFKNGEKCGETPRSLTVTVGCGAENKILSENEPSVCQYTMAMQSPAACDPAAMAAANLDPEGNPVKIESAAAEDQAEVDEIVYHDEL